MFGISPRGWDIGSAIRGGASVNSFLKMVVEDPNLRIPVADTGLYFDKGDYFDLDYLENQSCSVVDNDHSVDSSDDDDIPRPRKKSRLTSFEQNIHLTFQNQ
jgi:hypothetical protein